ncbi:MAG: GTPase Era [Alphaproteobacteria bacterium]|jgi:GTPase|nr:GTPase Era [Rhodospirillaceae bacterium]MBT3700882.1 GTPase Era [Alphaproteobacteria bacterium]MBT4017873.1 GTPase Era [Alphaproteobacteria bacterium]MBT4965129.1 GTPase Era [Alphaproteobacteria bacterium]MBT5158845.1 GTPase Era [Alphaproteobacteria bacterium]
MSTQATRCGYVALIGAPNAGKSTLLNALVGAKVAIVSPKVQTTRARLTGIAIEDQSQMIFVDTPGIFEPKRRLERAMVSDAWSGAGDADVVALLVDSRRPVKANNDDTQVILDALRKRGKQALLLINKVDAVERPELLKLADKLSAEKMDDGGPLFSDIFMISALTGDGVQDLGKFLAKAVPEGPWLYPEDQIATAPMRYLAAEVTREKLFLNLHQELPYQLTVETEAWEELKDGSAKVSQVVYVSRANHKGIVLGKGGSLIKKVGEMSRKDLEAQMDRRVHLFLFVKVRENWLDDPERYREMGLDFPKN